MRGGWAEKAGAGGEREREMQGAEAKMGQKQVDAWAEEVVSAGKLGWAEIEKTGEALWRKPTIGE